LEQISSFQRTVQTVLKIGTDMELSRAYPRVLFSFS